jgi:hypothetical protein
MERFWRTLREQCLDHCAGLGSLHDVQVRLLAWLNDRYLVTPHGGLVGRTPTEAYAVPFDPAEAVLDRFVGRAPRHAAEKGAAQ